MVWVLVISIALLVVGYMLSCSPSQAKPVTVGQPESIDAPVGGDRRCPGGPMLRRNTGNCNQYLCFDMQAIHVAARENVS
jgi:hypothetical protein